MKLFTRKELIDIWSNQSPELLDAKCCPSCRDILDEDNLMYLCLNEECSLDYILKSEVDK